MAKTIKSLVILFTFFVVNACFSESASLENEYLKVDFGPSPFHASYFHKATGSILTSGSPDGFLRINGEDAPWDRWRINSSSENDAIRYHLAHTPTGINFDLLIALNGSQVNYEMQNIDEAKSSLKTIDWVNLPAIIASGNHSLFREHYNRSPWMAFELPGIIYKDEFGYYNEPIKYSPVDANPLPTVHTTFYDGEIFAAVHSNFRVAPLMTQILQSDRIPQRADFAGISLNTYHHRAGNVQLDPLKWTVVISTDINGDNFTDETDYFLWLNRRIPDVLDIYKNTIAYKIRIGNPNNIKTGKPRETLTTFKQVEKIVKGIYELTDGIPQIVYMVGWQYEGHDSGYPSMYKVNDQAGTAEELREMAGRIWKNYNTIISYHINIDDSYRDHPGFDESILTKQPDGTPLQWARYGGGRDVYHINHTLQVETGAVFKRLDTFLNTVPVREVLHVDAFRNVNVTWQPRYIGEVEELQSLLKVLKYFKDKGIDVNTEALNGQIIEPGGMFGYYWHLNDPQIAQLYHGKIVGGGRYPENITFGLGGSINGDWTNDTFENDINTIKDKIFLGNILNQFYLEHEMLALHSKGKGTNPWFDRREWTAKFSEGIKAVVSRKSFEVTQNGQTFATDQWAYIYVNDRIYAYSRVDGEVKGKLPDGWTNKKIFAHETGSNPQPIDIEIANGKITISVRARQPVILKTME